MIRKALSGLKFGTTCESQIEQHTMDKAQLELADDSGVYQLGGPGWRFSLGKAFKPSMIFDGLAL